MAHVSNDLQLESASGRDWPVLSDTAGRNFVKSGQLRALSGRWTFALECPLHGAERTLLVRDPTSVVGQKQAFLLHPKIKEADTPGAQVSWFLGEHNFGEKRATGDVSAEKGGRRARESNPERPKSALPKVVGSCYDGNMTKSKRGSQERTLGAKAYASMARVEGLRLSKESMARLENTKGLSPEKRRTEVLRTYSTNPPKRK